MFCGMGPPGELLKVKELFKGKKGKKVKNLRHLRHLRDKNISHADLADYADCQLIYPCSSVSLRLTKTDIHPLKSMWALPCCHASAFVL